jgi:hypothetical protein
MIEIRNITYREYLTVDDRSEYDFAIKYSYEFNKPVDTFQFGDFVELKFGLIKDIQFDVSIGLTWDNIFSYIKSVKGLDVKEIAGNSLVSICQFKSYILEEIKRINEIETISLGHTVTADEEAAGIKELAVLGAYTQFRALAKEDITKIEYVKNMKYEDCFLELVAQKLLYEYQERFMRLKSKI